MLLMNCYFTNQAFPMHVVIYAHRHVSVTVSEPERSWARFPYSGIGRILYSTSSQSVSPSSFPSLGVAGLDFPVPGHGQIL